MLLPCCRLRLLLLSWLACAGARDGCTCLAAHSWSATSFGFGSITLSKDETDWMTLLSSGRCFACGHALPYIVCRLVTSPDLEWYSVPITGLQRNCLLPAPRDVQRNNRKCRTHPPASWALPATGTAHHVERGQAVAVAAGAAGAAAVLLPDTACSSASSPLQALTPSLLMDACNNGR